MTVFEGQIKELSKLIYNWNIVNVESQYAFDNFSKKILNALNNDDNEEKIRRIIESELCVTFGLHNYEFDSNFLIKQIGIIYLAKHWLI